MSYSEEMKNISKFIIGIFSTFLILGFVIGGITISIILIVTGKFDGLIISIPTLVTGVLCMPFISKIFNWID